MRLAEDKERLKIHMLQWNHACVGRYRASRAILAGAVVRERLLTDTIWEPILLRSRITPSM